MSSDTKLESFAGKSLELVSPFEIISISQEERTFRDGRKGNVYIITAVPAANRSVQFQTMQFKGGYDQIRAIRFLNPKALIKATQNGKVTTFSGVSPPP